MSLIFTYYERATVDNFLHVIRNNIRYLIDHIQVNVHVLMMMNCFCGMVDRRKAFSLISNRDYCQRSSSSRISYTSRAGFEPAQNLSSGLKLYWSCTVVITSKLRRHDTTHFNVNKFQAIICLINFDDLTALIICLDSF